MKSALILAATGSYKQANCHQLMPVIESSWTPSAADGDLRYFTSRSPQLQVLTKLLTLLHQSGESNVGLRRPQQMQEAGAEASLIRSNAGLMERDDGREIMKRPDYICG